MLQQLSKDKKKQTPVVEEDSFGKGLFLIRGKLYKQAIAEFTRALEENREVVAQKLLDTYSEYSKTDDDEAILSLGLVITKIKDDDCELFNALGNCARRLKNFPKANELYRKALRIDRSFSMAFYNLAASMGKVNKFDLEVKKSIDQFGDPDDCILPEYLNDPEIVNKFIRQINARREKQSEQIQTLIQKKEEKLKRQEVEGVKKLVHRIESEEKKLKEPIQPAVYAHLRQVIKKTWKQLSIEQSRMTLQGNRFNLGLYALSQKDSSLALECFNRLKKESSPVEHLDMMVGLCLHLEKRTEEATQCLLSLLNKDPNNRYLNVNLGIVYKKAGNRLLSYKYLIVGAFLLEQSDGLYSSAQISRRADEYYESKVYDKALKLYRLVASEKPNVHTLMKIGNILLQQDNLVEAIVAFREIQHIDPDSKHAELKLRGIHNKYFQQAEQFFQEKNYVKATDFYDKALELFKLPETLLKAADTYRRLKNAGQASELHNEYERVTKQKKGEELEKKRQMHIEKGKAFMKRKDFNNAIVNFEEAFKMKVDKDVFVFLAHIFKGLKQTRKLSELTRQWKGLMDREVKMQNTNKED